MGSAAINPGVSDLLQTLSNLNSPVLSSPAVVSALEKASPSDIVQLSAEATQLEGVDAMFGITDGSDDSGAGLTSAPAGLQNSAVGLSNSNAGTPSSSTPSTAASSTASLATQLANYQVAMQSDETQALLGNGTNNDLTGSLFDLTG